MNIFAKEGAKVVPIFKDGVLLGGYEFEKETAMNYLKEGEIYKIDYTEIHSFSTDVFLKEFPGISFNSVHFEDAESGEAKIAIAKKRLES